MMVLFNLNLSIQNMRLSKFTEIEAHGKVLLDKWGNQF